MASGPCTTWKAWRLWPQMLPGLGWAAALIFQWPAGWVRGRSIFSVVRTDIHWIGIAVQVLHIGRHRRSNRLAKASEGFVKVRQIDHDRNQHWPQVVLSKLVLVCYLCWLELFYNKGRTLTIPCILSASFGHPEVSHSSFLQNGVNECPGKDSVLASLLEVRCVRFFHGHFSSMGNHGGGRWAGRDGKPHFGAAVCSGEAEQGFSVDFLHIVKANSQRPRRACSFTMLTQACHGLSTAAKHVKC